MVENGTSGGAWPLLPGESHDEFLELCALSTTDLLSAEERQHLEEHLQDCPTCREMHAQYQALVDTGVPLVAVGSEAESSARTNVGWSVEDAEKALFARLDREERRTNRIPGSESSIKSPAPEVTNAASPDEVQDRLADGLWREMWWQYAAAILLAVALGVWFYRAGIRHGTESAALSAHLSGAISAEGAGKQEDEQRSRQDTAGVKEAGAQQAELTSLRADLKAKSAEAARLESEKATLEQTLHMSQGSRAEVQENADILGRQLAQTEADLAKVREQLSDISNQRSLDTMKLADLEREVDAWKTRAGEKDQEIAREQELLEHDRDIRELMGSRNLYIAEVYDVAKSGQTQRPFGRVFYTEGKSLIFYAYDLDQQPGLKDANSFQAWGRRGPEREHAVSLGIFYADNASKKRWVLRTENPKTLADIDAVYVTVEPHGGSSHPSGTPLLFAYLRIEPNHP
jgi:hypothetical protein